MVRFIGMKSQLSCKIDTGNFEMIIYIVIFLMVHTIFLISALLPWNDVGLLFGKNYNIIVYLITMIIMMSLIILSIIVMHKMMYNGRISTSCNISEDRTVSLKQIIWRCLILVLCIAYMFFLYRGGMYVSASKEEQFVRSNRLVSVPYFVSFLFFYLLIICNCNYLGMNRSKSQLRKVMLFLIPFLVALLAYAPNPFADHGAGLYHIDAYVTSIINTAHMRGFDEYNTSIYGHYGLFFLPFIKLFGNNYISIALVVSIFTYIAFFSACYVCYSWIKNAFVFSCAIVSILGISILLFPTGQYYAILPHRILFPSVLLALISWIETKKVSLCKSIAILGIVQIISLIWNIETGMVCVLVGSVYYFERYLCRTTTKGSRKQYIAAFISAVVICILCVLLAYLILNGYNYVLGIRKWMSFRRFVYPIGSSTYNIDRLRLPLPKRLSLYVFLVAVFFISLTNSIIHLQHLKLYIDDSDQKKCLDLGRRRVQMCVAISGLGSLTYFMNRAAYSNISISWLQMVFAMSILSDQALFEKKSKIQGLKNEGMFHHFVKGICQLSIRDIAGLFLLFGLFCLSLESILNLDRCVEQRCYTWNIENLMERLDTIKEVVPENTYAYGMGVNEIYYQLGWDTGLVIRDWEDMDQESYDRFVKEVKKQDLVFAEKQDPNSRYYYNIAENYNEVFAIEIEGINFALFEKR